jgi:hypothetical protein
MLGLFEIAKCFIYALFMLCYYFSETLSDLLTFSCVVRLQWQD